MKNFYALIMLAFIGLSTKVNAQIVNIPDAQFKAALIANGVHDSLGYITSDTAKIFTGPLKLTKKNIANMTGIEAFTALTYLSCDSNYTLTSLDVSHNTALTHLNCGSSYGLSSLDVSHNIALTYLNCAFLSMGSLDVSFNTALDTLICNDNDLYSLDVSSNTALLYLNCDDNYFTSLDVSHNTALATLHSDYGLLTSIDVSHNPALTYLDCGFNSGISIVDISSNPLLTYLECSVTHIKSLDLSSNPSLTYLSCYNDSLSSLDLSSNHALTYLDCDNNVLTNLNVKNGNNHNLPDNNFIVFGNPDLYCIEVDDATYSTANWTVDARINFSINCSCSANFTIAADVAQLHHYIITNNASGMPPLHYDWSWGDFTDDDTIPYPTHTYADTGYYNLCLTITDSINCQSNFCFDPYEYFHALRTTNTMVSMTVVPPVITNVSDNTPSTADFFMYPNPVHDNLFISTIGVANTIAIFNTLGEIVYFGAGIHSAETISCADWPSGIYFIRLKSESGNVMKKFVKE